MPDAPTDDALVEELSRLSHEYAVLYRRAVQQAASGRADLEVVRRNLAAVAHDLRSPLAVITGAVELLADAGDLSSAQSDLVRRVSRAVEVVTSLADDLGSAAGMRQAPPTLAPVDVVEVVENVVSRHRQLLPDGIRLEVALPRAGSGRWQVLGEQPRLERMVDNLVGNAVKFSPVGGCVAIAVTGARPDGRTTGDPRTAPGPATVRVDVTDEGPGIRPEDHEAIFTAFYRTASAGTTPGTGLGLAIVREIADLHRARVRVRSVPGHGATFTVELPLLPGGSDRS